MSEQTVKPTLTDLVSRESGHIRDYMRGYARNGVAALRALELVDGPQWRAAAEHVYLARATRILNNLDDAALVLIAEGQIDVQALAAEVAREVEAVCR